MGWVGLLPRLLGEVEEHPAIWDLRLADVEKVGYFGSSVVAFGSSGLIVADRERVDLGVTVDFEGIANTRWNAELLAVVGSMGTIVLYRESLDYFTDETESDWTVYQAPTAATLVAAAFRDGTLIAVGDGLVVTLDTDTGSPNVIPTVVAAPPAAMRVAPSVAEVNPHATERHPRRTHDRGK